ncbi:5,10-methylenetetrahydrofolate reductase / Acetyl-CoA synthase corrinoid iron-sulfur protein, small subunit [hydrothermal vent metagenome]|uniref:5,10-methylenetetrahydrofolate reductase / Acetyl-CoA synthase corrinoid iron-sulfur protein, small subunit n=1 Tax=hydrothermal vent metagenome TaxID=652676 RepID=A0A3B0VFY5_9ZZZZ
MKSASRLEQVLKGGHFAVTGELGPPKSSDIEVVRNKARLLKGHVDAVNITDCQTAIVRMSSIAAGLVAMAEGVEPVIQMTCRDRNRIGMQSDILGAAALGAKNLLCLTGDHQKFGNHPGSKGVFDMDSIQMLGMMRSLRDDQQFQCGEKIKDCPPRLFLGAAANPFAGPPDFRAARMGKKIANGADFIQTQIVYNVEKFARFMEMARDLGLPEKAYILAGVTPPRSLGMARYMKKFVPGMDVPDAVIERLRGAADKEDEGINICVDIINQVKEIKGVAGVHIMAIEWESAVPEIVSRAGLDERPVIEDLIIAPNLTTPETIVVQGSAEAAAVVEEVTETAAPEAADLGEEILARARQEASEIVAAAQAQAAEIGTDRKVVQTTDDAGEHIMNEKERVMALESVKMGLDALKHAYGLNDDQFNALVKFISAQEILVKEPPVVETAAPVAPTPAPAASAPPSPAVPASTPPAAVEDTKTMDDAKEAAAVKEAEEAKKAAAAKAAEEAKKAADAKAAEEAKKAADAKAAEEAKKAADAKAAEEAKEAAAARGAEESKKAAAAETAAPAVPTLELEKTKLAERAAKIAPDNYTQAYNGVIRETVLGNDDNSVTVGGSKALPFQLFEGEIPHKQLIAMDVVDAGYEDWPEPLSRHFADVLGNPVAWAQKCVKEYGAEALCISLASTDPNGLNRDSAEAAKTATEVIQAVDVPIIVWGCGNADKDTDTLRELTAGIGGKKVCLAPLSDANYRSLGATAMAFQHPIVAASPIDVNLAKQLNILLENLGVSLDTVMMDPSVGALGYGIEYTYSVMERIRLAALTQQDEKLQVPIICNLGREVWKAKECRLPTDELLGDQERRGVMMEAITAACMLLCGGEVLIMRHPRAMDLAKELINSLLG